MRSLLGDWRLGKESETTSWLNKIPVTVPGFDLRNKSGYVLGASCILPQCSQQLCDRLSSSFFR